MCFYDVCGSLFHLDISGPEDQICLEEKVNHKRHKSCGNSYIEQDTESVNPDHTPGSGCICSSSGLRHPSFAHPKERPVVMSVLWNLHKINNGISAIRSNLGEISNINLLCERNRIRTVKF